MKAIFLLVIVIMTHFSQAVLCQSLFDSLSKWTKPKDTLKFIDIPRTNEEQKLKAQGHGEQFYAGVDEMHYLIQLGNYLRENSIDPSRTHIENFVPLIARHYRHLQEGLKKYYGPTKLGPAKHNELRISKIQADLNYRILRNRLTSYIGSAVFLWLTWGIRKVDQPLSLEAWQKLNLWWAILMQPKFMNMFPAYEDYFEREWYDQSIMGSHWLSAFKKKNALIEEPSQVNFQHYNSLFDVVFPDFPEVVILPTTSSLGVFAINQMAGGDRVVPIQLAHRVEKHDRALMSPSHIFHNDISHVEQTNYGQPLLGSPLFHQKLTSYFKKLSPQKREQAEIIYLLLIHELQEFTENSPSIDQITDLSRLLKVLSSSFLTEPPTYYINSNEEPITWDKDKNLEENMNNRLDELAEKRNQQLQEYLNSLQPEIRAFLTQKDVVIETFDNPQLLEESARIFVQAVQHVLQNHPDIIQN